MATFVDPGIARPFQGQVVDRLVEAGLPRQSFRFPLDHGSYTTPVTDCLSTAMSAA
jgi:hypothetical protein